MTQRQTPRLQQQRREASARYRLAKREQRREEQIRYRARLRNDVPEPRMPWPKWWFEESRMSLQSPLGRFDAPEPGRTSRQFGGEE